MFSVFVYDNGYCNNVNCRKTCIDCSSGQNVSHLKSAIALEHDVHYFITSNGKICSDSDLLTPESTYHIIPKLYGGKGGFGSMLRALGAQIEKTTNHEACRDLSGRRMRDVNNEKKLKEWISKKADLEREREEKRREKRAKMLQQPMHKFEDATYHKQKSKVTENLQDALSQGLMKSSDQNGTRKRKAESTATSSGKKSAAWLGFDLDEDVGSESDSSSTSHSDTPLISLESDITSNVDNDNNESCTSELSEAKPAPPVDETEQVNALKAVEKECPVTNTNKDCKDDETNLEKTDAKKSANDKNCESPVNLEEYSSAEQLEELGLDHLKNELIARGLKCGGTLQQRAERLFSVKGLEPHQIGKALLAKPVKGKNK